MIDNFYVVISRTHRHNAYLYFNNNNVATEVNGHLLVATGFTSYCWLFLPPIFLVLVLVVPLPLWIIYFKKGLSCLLCTECACPPTPLPQYMIMIAV